MPVLSQHSGADLLLGLRQKCVLKCAKKIILFSGLDVFLRPILA